jgi:hypothetical protein
MTEANLRIYQAAAKMLNTLIENKATNENRPLTYQEVYALIDLDEELYESAYIYLRRSGYVMAPMSEAEMWATKEGTEFLYREKARTLLNKHQNALEALVDSYFFAPKPTLPTPPTRDIILNNYGTISDSPIQQGTTSSSQTTSYSSETIGSLFQLLEELKPVIQQLALSESDKQEAEVAIADIEDQLSSSSPHRRFLRSSFSSLKRICESAAGGAIASGLVQKLSQAVALLENM